VAEIYHQSYKPTAGRGGRAISNRRQERAWALRSSGCWGVLSKRGAENYNYFIHRAQPRASPPLALFSLHRILFLVPALTLHTTLHSPSSFSTQARLAQHRGERATGYFVNEITSPPGPIDKESPS
jgi:hypothetical protein